MSKFKANGKVVEAYQHTPNPDNNTVSYPQWFLNLIAAERVRPMPDDSVHVEETPGGRLLPLPIGYWLIYEVDGDNEILDVVAPDIFEAHYTAV